jgi:hypothetical protein
MINIVHLLPTIQNLLSLLVERKYLEIEAMTNGVRLSAVQIQNAIRSYGRTLVIPPESAFGLIDPIEVNGIHPAQWSINLPLWTKEEGRSDLSIEMTIIETKPTFTIELDDIRVL